MRTEDFCTRTKFSLFTGLVLVRRIKGMITLWFSITLMYFDTHWSSFKTRAHLTLPKKYNNIPLKTV